MYTYVSVLTYVFTYASLYLYLFLQKMDICICVYICIYMYSKNRCINMLENRLKAPSASLPKLLGTPKMDAIPPSPSRNHLILRQMIPVPGALEPLEGPPSL